MRALILSRLVVEYSRVLMDDHAGVRRNSEVLADNLLLSAVYVGQFNGRRMTAHKLAQFSGMSRPTVVRKLRELEAAGLLATDGSAAYIPDSIIESEALAVKMAQLSRIVMGAARELSKLDSVAIAQRKKK